LVGTGLFLSDLSKSFALTLFFDFLYNNKALFEGTVKERGAMNKAS
jgi:hypothetical protein